jgi:hypothetical protein
MLKRKKVEMLYCQISTGESSSTAFLPLLYIFTGKSLSVIVEAEPPPFESEDIGGRGGLRVGPFEYPEVTPPIGRFMTVGELKGEFATFGASARVSSDSV